MGRTQQDEHYRSGQCGKTHQWGEHESESRPAVRPCLQLNLIGEPIDQDLIGPQDFLRVGLGLAACPAANESFLDTLSEVTFDLEGRASGIARRYPSTNKGFLEN